ncbi:hypothetical protein NP493_249g02038 [Ridgeia piscesae]|uniref:Uncharacterized protein n=1 Tax=Ridgeia piscesae TaxID=27915 RepID=A0AAD9NYM0_RIDPI|nr:hypothetical protein NP493_249g02038 [Ridgeia piscesae]
MDIYTDHCPSTTQEIMKYMQLIRTMSHDAPSRVFLTYDRDFRNLRTNFTLPWCVLHQEPFHFISKAAGIQGHPFANQNHLFLQHQQPVAKRQHFPTGYCFAFCSEGRCSNQNCNFAPFKHPPTPFHRSVPPFKRCCGQTETLGHVLQVCHRFVGSRIKLHDALKERFLQILEIRCRSIVHAPVIPVEGGFPQIPDG